MLKQKKILLNGLLKLNNNIINYKSYNKLYKSYNNSL